jgi:hypothetical protein
MDRGDQIFYSVVAFVLLTLLWLRFVEQFIAVWAVIPVGVVTSLIIFNWSRIRGAS